MRPRHLADRASALRRTAALLTAIATVGGLTACGSSSHPALALTAALPSTVPSGTVLRIGDPAVQIAIQAAGLDKELAADGVTVKWANISGGPDSIKAFRGNQLDCSAVADIPSLFAHWTGTSTQIVFQSVTVDPLAHPVYKLGVAPGKDVKTLADLKGKKIAYSPGQAQGALVLRVLQKAGLTKNDVTLVDLPSTASTYNQALGSHAVDVAPLGTSTIVTYLKQYPGSSAITTGIRDDASTLYCLTSSVKDTAKAAALQEYVAVRTKALLWENAHPDQWAKLYYEQNQGLSAADAQHAVQVKGLAGIPATWTDADARLQATADLLAADQGNAKFDVSTIVDTRFAGVEAAAAGSNVVTGGAS
ncbi:putative ABC-type sulfonate transport system [Catenulispora acidiphila DSM 44928]|uniref:Putative ABC-type sulfonate transport system n=1 Tax=Catenulispora acidiphila (strain DSM 44928 / JCM 14897 / NBRC 102108 / NRRL B-24433 / ID139908) TaxID=479433 RepID=C7QD88_CATAD|nr:ABC transporter substrate-binding protein [Catenulispora acidiphila]ACU72681.1 putative ABC-type sulfonate transport system [Catenulispora acidiphila DSM 44928]